MDPDRKNEKVEYDREKLHRMYYDGSIPTSHIAEEFQRHPKVILKRIRNNGWDTHTVSEGVAITWRVDEIRQKREDAFRKSWDDPVKRANRLTARNEKEAREKLHNSLSKSWAEMDSVVKEERMFVLRGRAISSRLLKKFVSLQERGDLDF